MGKRRGEVEEVIRRVVALRDTYRGYSLLVVDRSSVGGVRKLPVESISRVERGFLVLDDNTYIPLHRIVALVDPRGTKVWERGRTSEGKNIAQES